MVFMLQRLSVAGFKSIERLQAFEPRALNVLIGPNGAGKSNLLSLFRMLSSSLNYSDSLPGFVGQQGGASKLLFQGSNRTRRIHVELEIRGSQQASMNEYAFVLTHAAGDTFIYSKESFRQRWPEQTESAPSLGAGHIVPKILREAESGDATANIIVTSLRRIVYHQFHNTASNSRMREKWHQQDAHSLKDDAGNLGAFLMRLRGQEPSYYRRIRTSVQQVLPDFEDFVLEPEFGHVLLQWREKHSDMVFSASQASDGMLRIFALIALLQQPPDDLPPVMILDEPELGLHPAAIEFLGALMQSASNSTQIFVATQSPQLVDCFEPEDVVVVDRANGASQFRRYSAMDLKDWLEEFTFSEIWRKNLVGGRP